MTVWIYTLQADLIVHHPALAGIDFDSEWCSIHDSTITVRKNYAWDGCSPKFKLGAYAFGVPDGKVRSGMPVHTGRASAVHDALCQYKHQINITQTATVQIFNDLLRADGWVFRPVYVFCVDKFGPRKFGGD